MSNHYLYGIRAGKGRFTSEHLGDNATSRVQIRRRAKLFALTLFGTHVQRTAHKVSCLRDTRSGGVALSVRFNYPEIDQFHHIFAVVPCGQNYVARFDVSVEQTGLLDMFQSL